MTKTLRRALLVAIMAVAAVVATTASAKTTAAPRATGEAHITGTKEVGHVLSVNNGAWANAPTSFSYQWYRCDNPGKTNCQPINGATRNRYRLSTDDAGHTIYASVTASNREGSATTSSDPVGPISGADAPANSAAPTVSGTPPVGQTRERATRRTRPTLTSRSSRARSPRGCRRYSTAPTTSRSIPPHNS